MKSSRGYDINRLRAIQERLKTVQSPEELRLTHQPASVGSNHSGGDFLRPQSAAREPPPLLFG